MRDKLVEKLNHLGFDIVEEQMFHPELKTVEERSLLTGGLESVKESLVSLSLIEEEDLNTTITSTKELEADFEKRCFIIKCFKS